MTPRFRVSRYRDRWYVIDTRHGLARMIVAVGPDARPSNLASLTLDEATAIQTALNALHDDV